MQLFNATIAEERIYAPEKPAVEAVAAVKPAPRLHLGYIDGLRALAALYVMLAHAALQIWPIYTTHIKPQGLEKIVFAIFAQAHFAVSVFIVVSGFCLMLPVVRNGGVLKGGALVFFQKRARRILPPYYCAMALSLLLIAFLIGHKTGTHWDSSIPVTWKGLLAHLLLVQDFYGSPQINHVFWSIAVEWQIYFLFPALILFWGRWGSIKTTLASLLLSLVGVLLIRRTPFKDVPPQYLGLFVTGMLAAVLAYSPEDRWQSWRERLPWTPILLVLGTFAFLLHLTHRDWQADYFVGAATMALLVIASQSQRGWLPRTLSARPLAFVGAFAYSLYLVHAPLLQVIWQYALHPLHLSNLLTFALLASIGGPLIVVCAYLFYLVCERPFVSTGRR